MISSSLSDRYRCTIVRGKSQKDIEDYLPSYAEIIKKCEGLSKSEFTQNFNNYFAKKLFGKDNYNLLAEGNQKTIDNHRTEIVLTLFGMCYFVNDSLVVSDRTLSLIENNDFPFFFKSIVYKFQFPNGFDKSQTIKRNLKNNIRVKPFHMIIQLLMLAESQDMFLTKNEIAYYILDSLKSLQGKGDLDEILDSIKKDRLNDILRKVSYPNKESSYGMQHITEQLNLLELSNLIFQKKVGHNTTQIVLNNGESDSLSKFLSEDYSKIDFDVYNFYDFESNKLNKEELDKQWNKFYCIDKGQMFKLTSLKALRGEGTDKKSGERFASTVEIGEFGENLVFEKEKERVTRFNSRLAKSKLKLVADQRGLGYDIVSIWADWAGVDKQKDSPLFIEVKTTTRIHEPTLLINGQTIEDSFNLTRNEYLSAEHNKGSYLVYRLYVTRNNIYASRIFNPLEQPDTLCTPISYNYEFNSHEIVEKWEA